MIHTDTLYLGVDGGGTRCRARLRNQSGRLLGSGEAGPANVRLGFEQARAQVVACTQAALQQAGLADYPLHRLYAGIGLAGMVLDNDPQASEPLQSLFARCRLSHDAHIACLGAHGGRAGAIVIVGTGSCAQVISPDITRTYGGWGFEVSDQASGAWLGRRALSYALQALEGIRPLSSLHIAIGSYFNDQPSQLLRWSCDAKPADYASFAPLVFEHANTGDKLALSLVQSGCEQLELLIQAVERHDTQRVSLVGGLAANYQHHLPTQVQQSLCAAHGDALEGALLMAGLPCPPLSP